jgi:glycosyltransferase 2 family protein
VALADDQRAPPFFIKDGNFFLYNKLMRKLLAALALLLGVLFIISRFTELQSVVTVLKRGNLFFLGLALLVQMAWIYNLSAFYQAVYHVLGIEEKRTHFFRLVTAAYFITVVAPSAGLSAIAVFVSDAKRKGRSVPRVTVASVLYIWFEYIGNLAILILGLAELAHRNRLHWSEITASLILLAGALGISLLLYLGMKSATLLGSVLAWMAQAVNTIFYPFIRRTYLPVERAYTFSNEIAEGISILRVHPRWVYRPLLLALLNKGLLFLVLGLSFLAFGVPVDAGTLIAGLSIAQLFLIVSPTPAGIGIVEGILAVALRALGLALEDATVVTLAYRGFSFWVPLLVGMVTIRLVSHGKPILAAIQEETAPAALQE